MTEQTQTTPSRSGDIWGTWTVLLIVTAACVLLGLGGDAARSWARYEREALEAGQHWRLVTAHLAHLGWGHLLMNVAALLLLGGLLDQRVRPLEWLGVAGVSAAAIDAGLYLWEPDVEWYVGLSGVLHGLIGFGALRLLAHRSRLGAWLLAALVAKILLEQWSGPLRWSQFGAGGAVIVAAHLYGGVGGVAAGAATALLGRRGRPL